MMMADRSSLKFVGFVFATVTLAVMLTAGMVVKSYADGVYTIETPPSSASSQRIGSSALKFSGSRSASLPHRKRQQSDEADRDRAHAMRRLPQRH
jgi:hypothetical protein